MRTNVNKIALLGLHASVAVVVAVEAALLALAPAHMMAFHKTGLPDWIRVGLAWGELFFAALFLVPRTMMLGGCGLLAIFTFAMGLHLLHGDTNIGVLVVYAAAVAVIMTGKADAGQNRISGSEQ